MIGEERVGRAGAEPDVGAGSRTRLRVALVSNLCPHYRRPLFEALAARVELECFFFAEAEPYWNPLLPAHTGGSFQQARLRRVTVLGEPLLPGIAARLTPARYDAVVVGLAGRLMVPFVFALARARGLPLVLWTGTWWHPQTPFHRITRPVVHAVYRRAGAIVVYGDHVRRALTRVRGVDDAKIFTAAQAVDGARFDVEAQPAASHELVFVGQLQPWKGVRELVSAFAGLERPSLHLSLVGNGPLEQELRDLARRDPRILFVGHVPQEGLPDILRRARCLVLPSTTTAAHREAWGLVVNEAMHAGLPVVASDAVGAAAHGLVADGQTGLVVPEGDVGALRLALARIADDDELVARMGRAARERVAGYTFASMVDAFVAAIEHARSRR